MTSSNGGFSVDILVFRECTSFENVPHPIHHKNPSTSSILSIPSPFFLGDRPMTVKNPADIFSTGSFLFGNYEKTNCSIQDLVSSLNSTCFPSKKQEVSVNIQLFFGFPSQTHHIFHRKNGSPKRPGNRQQWWRWKSLCAHRTLDLIGFSSVNTFFWCYQSHTIHVWYIYLHLVDVYGKCREIYHTWMIWELRECYIFVLNSWKWCNEYIRLLYF